ncbi:MAG: 4-hydroxythreonine-4-phosphate dehydrogenase PdxA [Magnetovibrio sp.]|nr:4-hydroxythreonine-4-phosphate dehydrogenase PdxA [Magnetovibrio sp.]
MTAFGNGGNEAPLALTMGEPAGVGAELTLKSWMARAELARPFVAIDSRDRLAAEASRQEWSVPIEAVAHPAEAEQVFARALPVIDTALAQPSVPGELDPQNAGAAIRSIETAVELVRDGTACGVVTNPIHKHNLYDAGFRHPGHTEFLAELAGTGVEPVMMLACEGLRTVPITTHVSLRDALDNLTTDLIVSQGQITAGALRTDFGIDVPRIAVAGLNPHAGEDGAMGDEEDRLIRPAVERLRALGIVASGPYPPDTLFSAALRTGYDAAICMYHDQALIPIKTLDFTGGVNVTLGLPFVRTSPDHGTALDIAGRGIADETSMLQALRMAASIASRRAQA